MTTIACDGHWMAADGLVTTTSGIAVGFNAVKIQRLKDGSIMGASGPYHIMEMLRALLDGETSELKIEDGWDAIRLMPDGTGRYYCDKHPSLGVPCPWPAVLGSGGDLALGAMLAGKTPKQAVEIAATRDTGSGGTITALTL